MATVWLVFLGFPLWAAIVVPATVAGRAAAVALVLAFGGYYFLIWRHPRPERSWWNLGVLSAIALLTYPLIGMNALGMAPFLVAFSAFAFTATVSYLTMLALVGATGVVLAASGTFTQWWFMLLPPATVAMMTGVIRFIDDRQQEFQDVQDQYTALAERERIARDLHDLLGQSLTAIALKAQVAQHMVWSDPERTATELAQIQALARQAIGEVRDTVGGLRARDLTVELSAAREVLASAGVRLTVAGDPHAVLDRCRVPFAWSLREAVTNVARHSHAHTCVVTFGPSRLVVDDDGEGRRGAARGNGLTGLMQRLQQAGGTLAVSDLPDGGTRVEVRM